MEDLFGFGGFNPHPAEYWWGFFGELGFFDFILFLSINNFK
jgi:hypothetical protein